MKRILFLSAFLIAIGSPFAKAEVLTCDQAAQHIGEVPNRARRCRQHNLLSQDEGAADLP